MKIIIEKIVYDYIKESMGFEMTNEDYKKILRAYLEAAIFTEQERLEDEVGGDIDFSIDSFEYDSWSQAYNDIVKFVKMAGQDAIQEVINEKGLDQLGYDLWMTRNGHGVGFWEDSYEHEDQLMKAAEALRGVDLYVTDEGELAFL